MVQIIRTIADFNGSIFTAFMKFPATEDDKQECAAAVLKWINDPRMTNWRIELCEGEIDNTFDANISEIMITWPIT